MSDTKARPGSRHPVTWAVVTVLLLVPFVGLLWVPFYAKATPKAGGFPFFYWYQLAWIPAVAVLSILAYLLLSRRTRRGGGRYPEPAGSDYGQPPPGGWYGQPPANPPGTAGGTQPGRGTGANPGTEATS